MTTRRGHLCAGRPAALAFGVVLVLGLVVLALAGRADPRRTAFAANVPASGRVGVLRGRAAECQGPVAIPADFDRVTLWIGRSPNRAELSLSLRRPGQPVSTARAAIAPSSSARTITAVLPSPVRPGGPLTACFALGPGQSLPLLGGAPSPQSGTLKGPGVLPGSAASLLFLTRHPRSLTDLVPTILSRAALFRASWMGPWLLWGLLVLCALAIVGLGAAVARAAAAETSSEEEGRD